MGKQYVLYSRERKNGPVYYVKFKNPDGSWGTGKSTGLHNKKKAEAWAIQQLLNGDIPAAAANMTLKAFSKGFFQISGEWATDKKITGKRVTERQCSEKTSILENRIIPPLGEMDLSKIDKTTIKTFRNELFTQGLAGSTINKTLSCLKAILEAAEEKNIIRSVPKIERASARPRTSRGILSLEEVKKLFTEEWWDYRAMVMNLTAAVTGLRQGELLALQIKDFNDRYINVQRSWDQARRVMNETTKTGRGRTIIIPGDLTEELIELINMNPWGGPEAFLFYSTSLNDKPMDGKLVNKALYMALEKIGIKEAQRKERNITFHSWRHWFNSLLINEKIPLQKIQSLTGHLTPEMTQHYYHLDDLLDIQAVQEKIFN